MHLTPAGLPYGIPGIGDDIDAAMQQAPQPGRHSMGDKIKDKCRKIKGEWQAGERLGDWVTG
jgi:hypothetical protein